MTPKTTIDMLKAKLYLGNKRAGGNAANAIAVQEEYLALEAWREITIGHKSCERYWKSTWIDEVNDLFNKRNIEISTEETKMITHNKTIMAHAIDYAKEKRTRIKRVETNKFRLIKKRGAFTMWTSRNEWENSNRSIWRRRG